MERGREGEGERYLHNTPTHTAARKRDAEERGSERRETAAIIIFVFLALIVSIAHSGPVIF